MSEFKEEEESNEEEEEDSNEEEEEDSNEEEEDSNEEEEDEDSNEDLSPEDLEILRNKISNVSLPSLTPLQKKVTPTKILKKLPIADPKPSIIEKLKPITIQPTSVSEIEASLSPRPGRKGKKAKKVEIPTELVVEGKKKIKTIPLETILVRNSDETQEFFIMRSSYSRMAEKLFPKEESSTHLLLGFYGANRGKYGVTYPDNTQKVLDYIDNHILSA